MTLAVTPIYTSLLALLFLVLSWRVIAHRRANKLNLGDQGDKQMLKRIRAQGNCAEYAPIGLLLLLVAELQGAPASALHLLGLALLLGRGLHAYGVSSSPQNYGRQAGMILTLVMIAVTALGLLAHTLIG